MTTLLFEARIWREPFTGNREIRIGYICKNQHTSELSEPCAICGESMYNHYKDESVTYPAEWGVYDVETGVRIAYAKSEEGARKAVEKWNVGSIPAGMLAKAESARTLRKLLQPGDTVQTILRHVSSSGMSRRISCVVTRDGNVQDITWHVARVLEEPIKGRAGYVQDAGITQGGCGMDMGFNLVYNLSRVLFADGFTCIGKGKDGSRGCPANDHSNGDRDYTPHLHENAGGYALNQRWL